MSEDQPKKQTKQQMLKEFRDQERAKLQQDPDSLAVDFDIPVFDEQEQYGDDGIFITARKQKMDLRQRMRSGMKTERAEDV
jgi:predicted protein tyrosine phosphatase